jgi:hypothetical protein
METGLKPLDSWVIINTESPFEKSIFFNKEMSLDAFKKVDGSYYDFKLEVVEKGFWIIENQSPFLSVHVENLVFAGEVFADCRCTKRKGFYTSEGNLTKLKIHVESERAIIKKHIDAYYSQPWV